MPHASGSRRALAGALLLASVVLPVARPCAAANGVVLVDIGRVATANAGDELKALLEGKGVVTELRTLPVGADAGDLAGEDCIWDLRVDTPLSLTDQLGFEAHVQSAGGLFLVGEHALFVARNTSLTTVVNDLGGGLADVSLIPDAGPAPQDIIEPTNPLHFLSRACTPVSEIDYDGVASGHLISFGTGTWLTGSATSGGAGIWGPGTLLNAPDGVVVVALDINFLSTLPGQGTLDVHVADPTLPTQNRPFLESIASYLCNVPCCAPAAPAPPVPPRSAGAPAAPRSPLSACSATSPASPVSPVIQAPRRAERSLDAPRLRSPRR